MGKNLLCNSVIDAGICRWRTRRLPGFTLLELLVTMSIVAILASIAYPVYTGYVYQAQNETAAADIRAISLKISDYYANNNSYPQSLSQVGYATYADPWGHPYQYLNIQTAKNRGQMRKDRFLVPINTDYDLYSMGQDGKSVPPLTAAASRDDVIRANDGAYIGLAYAY
ncbi:MAG TPA: prepilin-type N-terminal cleavage/methylation domain-containing protein [Thermodesulfovibrionales bacterium]|nr:prepilin-type N-terminal cleavage/methylation domain-containing protein [Thermodesulfovibrionales bacterium]